MEGEIQGYLVCIRTCMICLQDQWKNNEPVWKLFNISMEKTTKAGNFFALDKIVFLGQTCSSTA